MSILILVSLQLKGSNQQFSFLLLSPPSLGPLTKPLTKRMMTRVHLYNVYFQFIECFDSFAICHLVLTLS